MSEDDLLQKFIDANCATLNNDEDCRKIYDITVTEVECLGRSFKQFRSCVFTFFVNDEFAIVAVYDNEREELAIHNKEKWHEGVKNVK